MEAYLKITGVLFHVILLLLLLSLLIERRDMTYVVKTRYLENEYGETKNQDSCLYMTVFSFLIFNLELGRTDNDISAKDQFSDKIIINAKRKLGIKIINSQKLVAYIWLPKFWKRKPED